MMTVQCENLYEKEDTCISAVNMNVTATTDLHLLVQVHCSQGSVSMEKQ